MFDFSQFRILTFDCYGTLIDWETGILSVLRPWAMKNTVSASNEDLLRAYASAESVLEQSLGGVLYSDILRAVMNDISERFGVAPDPAAAGALARSVGDWPPFPDTVEALRALKQRFKIGIISNVDHASFARTDEKLGVDLDLVVTAEDAAAYKPDHTPFLLAIKELEEMEIRGSQILHVAQSLFHDHVPARELELTTVWVDRRRGKEGWGATLPPLTDVQPDLVVSSLEELAHLALVQ